MATKNYTRKISPSSLDDKFTQIPYWAWKDYTFKGYLNGCEGGKFAALSYIKYSSIRDGVHGGSLQHVVIGMAEKLEKCGEDQELKDGVRGQMVGFFSIMDDLVHFATMYSRPSFELTYLQIVDGLKDAESGGPEKRFYDQIKLDKSNSARAAANARWSKHKYSKIAES